MIKDGVIAGDSATVTSGLNSGAFKPNTVVIFLLLFENCSLFNLIPLNDLFMMYHLEFCTLSLGCLVKRKSASPF